MTSPPREVDLVDGGTCLFGGFLLPDDDETLMAIINVQPHDGHRLLRIGDPDEHRLPPGRGSAVRALTDLAPRSRFVVRDPFLRGQLLLGKAFAGAAETAELITATAAVEGVGIELLTVPALDDSRALTRTHRRMNEPTSGHLFTVIAAGEHKLREFAEQARANGRVVWPLEPLEGVPLQELVSVAMQRAVATVPGLEEPEPEPEQEEPPSRLAPRTVRVTLSKEGNRGGHDYLVRTSRDCRPRHTGNPCNAMGADKKRKGAERVAGLPKAARLKSLVACSTGGCNLCWATYVVPADSTWPD